MAVVVSNVTSNSPDATVVRNADGSFTVTHSYGTDTISSTGAISYTRNALFVALPYTGTVQTSYPFLLTLRDTATSNTASRNWTLNIVGEDDKPTITGQTTGNAVEDTTLTAAGTIIVNDPDRVNGAAFQSGTTSGTIAGTYGSLTINAAGQWVYTLANTNAVVQALPAGARLTDTVTVMALDGKTAIPVTITITGTNDVATVTSATASLVEKGTPDTVSGKLAIVDVDTGEAILGKLNGTAFTGSTTLKGSYGTLTLAADGTWSYKLDNSASATIALKGGQQVSEVFNVVSKDGTGTGAITISVTGTNDAPAITGATAGAVTENNGTAAVTTTGTLVVADADAGESGTKAGTYTGTFGSLVLDAAGKWTYTLTQSPEIIAMLTGQTKTDTVKVLTTDGTEQTITITINGLSSALNISAGTGNVAEDSVATATGTLTGNTAAGAAVTFDAATKTGTYGSLVLDAAGKWTYTLNNTAANVQALITGQKVVDTFTLTSKDGQTTTVTVNVAGLDDRAVITGTGTGTVVEDTTLSAAGKLTVVDPDKNADGTSQATFQAGTQDGVYGKLTLAADGTWGYALDNTKAQPLQQDETKTETFTVKSADGTTSTITVTVKGVNDVPTVTGATAAVAENNGTAPVTATGTVVVADADHDQSGVKAGTYTGTYGSVVLGADGKWTYTLTQSPEVVAMINGQTKTDTITFKTLDGTDKTIVVTINGTSQAVVVNTATGTVQEDTTLTAVATNAATGQLAGTDEAGKALVFDAKSYTGTYGTLAVAATGTWTYTLNNTAANVQALKTGDTVPDNFTVTAGGKSTTVNISVKGLDDAPVITGAAQGAVTENNGAATAVTSTGKLTVVDADAAQSTWKPLTDKAGTWGKLTLAADGTWTYKLNNTDPAIVSMKTGETKTDTIQVQTADGTTKDITITINGVSQAVVINTATGTVQEDTTLTAVATNAATGQLAGTDEAGRALAFDAKSYTGTYGTLAVAANGTWTYTLNNAATNVQALKTGDTVPDNFTVTAGGKSTTVNISVKGLNDAPVISGVSVGDLTETNGLTAVQTTGKLVVTDADAGQSSWTAVNDKAGTYGKLTLDAAGNWVYKLDYQNATVVALSNGQKLTDTVAVQTADGTTKNIVITINGIDNIAVVDQSVINAKGAATGVEDTSFALTWDRFGVTGVNGVGNLGVKVTSLPADGVLQLNGAAVKAGDTITKADIDAGKLKFVPDANESGIEAFNSAGLGNQKNDYAQFKFVGTDGTSTSAERVLTVDIRPVTDAPTWGGVNKTVTVLTTQSAGAPVYTEDFQDGQAQGWTARNSTTGATGGAEINTDNIYGAPSTTNQALEVEAGPGVDSLERTFTTQKDATYTFSFDYMGRPGAMDGTNSQVSVLVNGVVVKVVNTQSSDWSAQQITFVATGSDKIEFRSADSNTVGGRIDNLKLTGGGVTTVTSSEVTIVSDGSAANPVALTTVVNQTLKPPVGVPSFTDNDGSETHLITLKGVPAGFTVSDGTHTVTSTGGDITVFDAKGATSANWTLANLAVTPTIGYIGTITPVLHATSQDVGDVVKAADFNISLTWTPLPANNPAVVTGDTFGAVTENNGTAAVTTTGTLVVADPDANQSAAKAGTYAGTYGSVVLGADGKWTYTLTQSPEIISMITGQTKTDTVKVLTADGTEQTITITINGLNQAVVISSATGDVQEDTKLSVAGATAATGQLAGTDEAGHAIAFDAKVYTGTYGTLTVNSSGAWNYALNNSDAKVQALTTGQTVPDNFTVTAAGGKTTTVNISVKGLDDAPVISGVSQGTVTENNGAATAVTTTGKLTVVDADATQSAWKPVTDKTGTWGKLTLAADGTWTYRLNNTDAAIVAMKNGESKTDTIAVETADGTVKNLVITINGVSQGVVISSGSAALVEDAAPFVKEGTLAGTDINAQPLVFTAQTKTDAYGTFTLGTNGQWSYTLNNAATEVQALAAGQVVNKTFEVVTTSGDKTSVVVTITGTNDAPVIAGTATGTVKETNGTTAVETTGTLTVTDADAGQTGWQAVSNKPGTYGTLTLDANGAWTYKLTQSPTVIALLNGQTLTDTVTVRTADGTAKDVVITIQGTSQGVVLNNGTAAFTEDTAPYTKTGTLAGTDANGQAEVFPVVNKADQYGAFTLGSNGQWSYTLNNASSAVQALAAGETKTLTYDVTTTSGDKTSVVVTITGTNDVPVVSGVASGMVTETNGKTAVQTTGTLAVTDADAGQSTWKPVTDKAGTFGKLTLAADGTWIYKLNYTDPAIVAMKTGDTKTDTVQVQTADGTTKDIVVTINGASQAVVINSGSATLTEDAAPYVKDGTLTGTDLNAQALVFTAKTTTDAHGTFAVAADGKWTYTLNNAAAEVQALKTGDVVNKSFEVTTTSGDKTTVLVTINGTDDRPTITGAGAGDITENNGTAAVQSTGKLTVTDPDAGQSSWQAVTDKPGQFGTLSMDVNGNWTYKLTQSAQIVAMNTGDTKTDTIQVKTADGTMQDVVITIHGLNPPTGNVSGTLWNDVNGDGIRQSGETGLAGVQVDLRIAGTVTSVATATTDANGNYVFSNVAAGNYFVDFNETTGAAVNKNFTLNTPAGTTNNDVVNGGGWTGEFALAGGQTVANIDGGMKDRAGSVTGIVWKDTDGNGVRADSEAGIAGVTVQLMKGTTVVATATTGTNGAYSFADVAPDTGYTIKVGQNSAPLAGLAATVANAGGDDSRDSDITTLGVSDSFSVAANQAVSGVDAGYKPGLTGASISGAQAVEGQGLVFNVTVPSLAQKSSFDFSITGVTATAGKDYSTSYTFSNGVTFDAATGKISIPAGVTSFSVTVPTIDDTLKESNETLSVKLGTLAAVTGTIVDNDGAPIPTALIGSVDEERFSGITTGQTTTTGTSGTIDNAFGDLNSLFNSPGQANGQLAVDSTVSGTTPSTVFAPQTSAGFVQNTAGSWTTLGTYGKLTVAADGNWSYTADQNLATTQALVTGQVVNDSFVVRDGNGNDRTVQVAVHGTNDVPMGNTDFALLQGAGGAVPTVGMSVRGNVLANDYDYDKGESLSVVGIKNTQLVAGQLGQELQGAFGKLVIAADGSYTYTLDRQPSDSSGVATTPETFTYTVSDGHTGSDGKPVQTDVQLIIHFDDTKAFTVVQSALLGDNSLYANSAIHNVFQWHLSDLDTAAIQGDPTYAYTDKVNGFQAQAANGKAADVLDLADLLPSDQAQLDKYLNFSVDASGNTTVHVSTAGAYTAQGADAAHTNQNIVLQGVNLFALHGLNAATSGAEQALIQEMLKDGSLKI